MQPTLRSFWWALATGWLVLAAAAWEYARVRSVPSWIALPLAAAFLIEYLFYLASGFRSVRERLGRWPKPRIALAITVSGLVPYLVYTVPTGQATPGHIALAAGIFALCGFWYAILPRLFALDLLFLALLAGAILSGILRTIYGSPLPKVPLDILGHLGLIHSAIFAVTLMRGAGDLAFGFVPSLREIRTGLLYAGLFCIAGLPAAWLLGVVRVPVHAPPLWRVAGTLLGVFWVVAYSEEFLFRGLLQSWLSTRLANAAGLLIAAASFGMVHVNYGHRFPNWPVVVVAGLAGIFYGLAYRSANSVRASMVSHAVVVTLWKSLGG